MQTFFKNSKKERVKVRAALFDFDGTLVYSIDLLTHIFEEVLENNGFEVPSERKIRELIGNPLDEIFRMLTKKEDVEALTREFRAIEESRNNPHFISIVEETIPTLEFLQSQKIKIGVVSTKRKERVLALAADYKIDRFFDVVVGREEIEHPKPHPEPILFACERLKVEPREALFVGDSLLDLESAKSAKAVFVGVLTGVCTRAEFEKKRADYIFGHVGELTNLVRRLN